MRAVECFRPNCEEKFSSIKLYKIHLKKFHSIEKFGIFKCKHDKCFSDFTSMDVYFRHLRKAHGFDKEITSVGIENCSQIPQNTLNHNELESTRSFLHENHSLESQSLKDSNDDESNIEEIMKEKLIKFLSTIHQEDAMTKKMATLIFKHMKEDIIDTVLSFVSSKDIKIHIDNAFKSLSSFYKYNKCLAEKVSTIIPQQITISEKIQTVFIKGVPKQSVTKDTITSMSIAKQISVFLELPKVLDDILENITKIESSDKITNFIQCDTWKNIKTQYGSKIVLPLFLYLDDFEPDNALGSNAGNNKITAVYFTIPVIPQYLLSSPEYIFVAQLCLSKLKDANIEDCLQHVIRELKLIESEGIKLDIDGIEKIVYVVLGAIIGDNLALNETLGFQKSFNANVFCRICFTQKKLTQKQTRENLIYLRNENNYNEHIVLNDPKKTGIKFQSSFNNLKNFHVCKNLVADITHDIYEGIFRYDMSNIVSYFINDKKYFDLQTFNLMKQQFHYGEIEIGNLAKEVNDINHIQFSASESKTFLHFSTLIMGPKVPENDDKWKLLCLLVLITDELMQSELSLTQIDELKLKIEEYLSLYVKHFGENLKPKHHFLLHYHRLIKSSGPLRHLMTLPFEQKNKQVKAYSKVTNQRINLPWTLAWKASMKFQKFVCDHSKGFKSITTSDIQFYSGLNEWKARPYYNLLENEVRISENYSSIFYATSVCHKKTLFKTGFFISLMNDENIIEIYKIIDIIFAKKYFLVVEKYEIIKYSDHYCAYIVGQSAQIMKIVNVDLIKFLPCNLHKLLTGENVFRIKYV